MSAPMTFVHNRGDLDLDTIRVMGVSVKIGDSPIGYFGTGLKYALATLIRTGHIVALRTGGRNHIFGARDVQIRGETFKRIYMDDEALPFTTELGKNWQVWQAFRELHSNALDEGGGTSDKCPSDADTIFMVNGQEFCDCYHARNSIFISGTPFMSTPDVDIYRGSTNHMFYRGVRAHTMPTKALFTYNIKKQMVLTEDRTLRSAWDVEYVISQALTTTEDPGVAAAIMRGGDMWEHSLSLSFHTPSQTVAHAAMAQRSNATAHRSAQEITTTFMKQEAMYPEIEPNDTELATISEAFALLRLVDCDLDPYEVLYAETLGPSVLGLYHGDKNQIFVARTTIEQGARFLAQTLYEEWIHKRHHIGDNTRAMQDFLLGKLFAKL